MENVSVNKPLFSTMSEDASVTYWESFNLYSLLFLTTSAERSLMNELLLFVKISLVCWFTKQMIMRGQKFIFHLYLYPVLIYMRSIAGKVPLWELFFMWGCYQFILPIIEVSAWKGCLIYYIASFIFLAIAPNCFSHLAFTVDIYFVYNMVLYIFSRSRMRSLFLYFVTMAAYGLASYFDVLHSTQSPNMFELNLLLLMIVAITNIGLAFHIIPRSNLMYIAVVFGQCILLAIFKVFLSYLILF